MHGILFSNKKKEEICKFWKYGFIDIKDKTNKGIVNERTINYITKYITKTDEIHKEYKPIILASAGLGKKYIERYDSKKTNSTGKIQKKFIQQEAVCN